MSSVQQSQPHCPISANIPCLTTASVTSSYYTAPSDTVQYPYPLTGHLGFMIDIPHKPPEATPWYFGENPVAGRRELNIRPDPEYFAINNIIPYVTENIPMVNIYDPSYNFNRGKHTFYI